MIRPLIALGCAAASMLLSNCASNNDFGSAKIYKPDGQVDKARFYKVRTTAYSHTESDHLIYGRANAAGGTLQYGMARSAAADWSVFPLGTVFRIAGQPHTYTVDDYGSALVGTKTIDIYKPDRSGISDWGVRNVKIEVVRWGDYRKSLDILSDRTRYAHVRDMIKRIEGKTGMKSGS